MGNLVPCIRNALLRGYIAPPVLAPRIVSARQQWLDWHHDFAANQLPAMVAEDLELARKADAMDNRAEVVVLNPADTALQVGAPQDVTSALCHAFGYEYDALSPALQDQWQALRASSA